MSYPKSEPRDTQRSQPHPHGNSERFTRLYSPSQTLTLQGIRSLRLVRTAARTTTRIYFAPMTSQADDNFDLQFANKKLSGLYDLGSKSPTAGATKVCTSGLWSLSPQSVTDYARL